MAKLTLTPYSRKTKTKRPGIHAKTKTSKLNQCGAGTKKNKATKK